MSGPACNTNDMRHAAPPKQIFISLQEDIKYHNKCPEHTVHIRMGYSRKPLQKGGFKGIVHPET